MFVGTDEEEQRMEIVELEDHPYYVGMQYHPEYLSRPLKPSPPFLGLVLASVGKLQSYLNKGCRLSPRELSDNSSGEYESQVPDRIELSSEFIDILHSQMTMMRCSTRRD